MAPPSTSIQPGSNWLLDRLPTDERERMFNDLGEHTLTAKQIFARPDRPRSRLQLVLQRYGLALMNQWRACPRATGCMI
jgi:hypothetical protein